MSILGTLNFTGSDGFTPSGITKHPSALANLIRVSNQGQSDTDTYALYTFDVAPGDANQKVTFDLYLNASYGSGAEPYAADILASGAHALLRYNTSADTGYQVGWSNGRVKVLKLSAGTISVVGSVSEVYQGVLVDGTTVNYIATVDAANTFRVFKNGDTTAILTCTDSSSPITSAGMTGLMVSSNGGRWRVDNVQFEDGYTAPSSGPSITGPLANGGRTHSTLTQGRRAS